MITKTASLAFAVLTLLAASAQGAFALGAAQIDRTKGFVQTQAAGFGSRRRVSAPRALNEGQSLSLGDSSMAELTFPDRSKIRVGSGALLLFKKEKPGLTAVELTGGKLVAGVEHRPGRRFQVLTPAATVEVTGTVFSVEARSRDETVVIVRRGSVSVRPKIAHGPQAEIRVRAGEGVVIRRGQVRGWVLEQPPAEPARLLDPSLEGWIHAGRER